ncbi:hypothetical protein BGZ67_009571 [Mortierella alpina]|nr:hypothetical protein BGZ67_009571 [Mortierella alpina]
MAIIKSPVKTLSSYKSRTRTRTRSPETTVSGVLLEEAGLQGPRIRSAGTTQPRPLRYSSLPSLPPSEQPPSSATDSLQLHQPAAQQEEHPLAQQWVSTRRSPFAEPSHAVELLQPRLLRLHHQPQLQETMQQDRSRRAYSEPKYQLQQRDSHSDQGSPVGQWIRRGLRVQNLKDTDHAPSGIVAPLLRRAQGERLEAVRLYQVASQRLQQAQEREDAILFEQEMQMRTNNGDTDSGSSSSSVRHSGSEEDHPNLVASASHRRLASMQPPLRRVENERQTQTQQHESPAFSKRTQQLLLTPRTKTPSPVEAPEASRDQESLKDSKGDGEVRLDGESFMFEWREHGQKSIGKAGAFHHHSSSPGIKVKSEEREASYFAALKEEHNSGDRLHYQDYDVLIEIPSSVGSESAFGSSTSPQKRWRSPTPLPPKGGRHPSQGSPKPSTPVAAAGTSRENRRCSRSLPPRHRPTRSHGPRPRPYPPPQAATHSQQSTQTSAQGPRLFSRRFSDRLGSYPAVIFYTHIDHVENYHQQPHEHHVRRGDTDTAEQELPVEQDDDEVQPRGESPMM